MTCHKKTPSRGQQVILIYNSILFLLVREVASFYVGDILAHGAGDLFVELEIAAEEAGLSRIYAGQHFRTDHNAGKLLGQQVAESVIDTMLLPR